MAKIRVIDANNDFVFGHGLQDFAQADKAIQYDIKTRLQEWVGDFFADTSRGIDWLNRLTKMSQKALLDLDIRRLISQTDNVTRIISYSSTVTNRQFTATYNVETIYSTSFKDSINKSY
jgi:hypothetical protein